MIEQRQRNADAERLEAEAWKARMEAKAAADRIQRCQNSLQAGESKLAAKKHEISLKVGTFTFDPVSTVPMPALHYCQGRCCTSCLAICVHTCIHCS